MVSENSPDNLPPGWKEYVKVKNGKKTKYYSKAATGQKFYSKLAVMRYVNTPVDTPTPQSKTEFDQTPQMPIDHENEASASQADTVTQAVTMNQADTVSQADTDGPDTNGSTLMLPPGWITEVKTREGSTSKFKIYIDPATGKKFYSQPQVSRYLKALSNKEAPVEKNQDGADRPDTRKSPVVLPPGWTTEVETRTNGSTFKIYMDPSTGKKFYSLPQVSRYLNAQSHKEVPVEKNQDEADRPDTNEVNMPVDVVDTPTPQSKTEFNQTPQTPIDHGKEVSVSQADTDGPDTIGSTSWLPPGWITEVKSRMGSTGSTSTFKIYIDPATGKKFYSQPQVSRYLKALSHEESPVETIKDGVDRPDTNKSPVVLPPGWTTKVELRNNGSNFKVYVDPATGRRFYSLPQVSRYLKALSHEEVQVENNQDGADGPKTNISPIGVSPGWTTEVEPQSNGSTYKMVVGEKSASETDVYENQVPVKKQGSRSRERKGSHSKQTSDVTESGPADGLPVGWIKEIRTRHRANGIKKDPYYTDPVTGYVFRSKKDALRYLETGDIRSCSMKPMKAVGPLPIAVSYEDVNPKEDHRSISAGEASEVVNYSGERLKSDQLQNTEVDGLPIGWIREIQTRKGGRGKDTFYVDPVSGYMFRSKPDALRYIETGDISKCKLKPTKRDADDIGSAQQASGDDASGQHTSRRTRSSISNEENKISNNFGELVKTAPEESAVQLHTPAAEELPIGWTKETQIRKDGVMKDYFYTDPIGKYTFRSKRDALCYIETGDISKCASRPKIRDINGTGSKKQNDVSQHLILGKDQRSISKSEENTISNYSGEPVQNSAVEGLPTGWTREIQIRSNGIGRDSFYIDPVSGYMFRSKMDALRYIETGDISKCAIKPKKKDVNDAGSTKQVTSDDVSQHSGSKRKEKTTSNYSEEPVQNSAVEGLPVGWTREIQMRRDGIGKDSFYIDPVSGYMFRSKTDALRYIETGDISKCAIKPKKRDANAAGSAEHVADPLTPVSRKNSVRSTGKQLFIGEKSNSGEEDGDASISKPVKSESSKRKRGSTLPSGNGSPADSSTKRTSGRTSKRLAGYQPEMPNLQVSERDLRAAMKMTCEDEASILPMITSVSSIALPPPVYSETTSVDGNPSREHEIPKMSCEDEASVSPMITTNASPVALPLPVYSETTSVDVNPSHEREIPNLQVSEPDLRAAMKMSYADEASISPMITTNASPVAMPLPVYSQTTSVDGNPSHEQTLPKRVPKLKVSRSTPANSRKSNKGITPSTPVRASQQPWIDINDVPQPFQSGLSTNKAAAMSAGDESRPLDTDVSDVVSMVVQQPVSRMDVMQKNVATSAQQINEKQDLENSKPQDVQGGYQFVDPLPNPFMNFTYSNPTSVTPDEGNLAYQGFSQQQTNNPFFQGNEYSAWSGSQSLGYSQDGNPSHANSVRQQPHVQQFSSQNLGYSQDGNPSHGNAVSQQAHLQQFSSTFATPGFGYPSSFGSSNTQQPTSDNRNNTPGFGYPPPFDSSGSQQPPSDNRNNVYKRHQ